MSIILDKVNYVYSEKTAYEAQALKDINLQIKDGEFIGIIGHTGSGKSTLIQHLNGLLRASSGGIYYNGRDIYEDDYDKKQLRSKVGLVFQYPEHQLFDSTIFSDVCFGPRNLGLSRKDAELRAFSALRSAGLPEKYWYRSPFELSGGQKRRAAIAGVLAMRPEVLILDEPSAGLDPAGRSELLKNIRDYHARTGGTVVLVSHSMDEIAENVQRILVLSRSGVVMSGTPHQVFSRAGELEAVGLSVPQITKVAMELRNRGVAIDGAVYTVADLRRALLKLKGGGADA